MALELKNEITKLYFKTSHERLGLVILIRYVNGNEITHWP